MVIFIFAAISAGLITAVTMLTKDRIALNEELKLKRSVLNTFSISYTEEEIVKVFDNKIKIKDQDQITLYLNNDNGKLSGLAFEIKGPGFWGQITALVALEPDLESIQGIEILAQEETPGLGGRITEDDFKDQFKGKTVEPTILVDAITGATMTSKAFSEIINNGVKSFKSNFKLDFEVDR